MRTPKKQKSAAVKCERSLLQLQIDEMLKDVHFASDTTRVLISLMESGAHSLHPEEFSNVFRLLYFCNSLRDCQTAELMASHG